ncbi:outer membrane autotransporter protein [Variovorax paradoxus]|uniref:autotransporter outer membrane beta-barrel domain-containing protein n=1 Tax=Variovorax paradoxus TaxID=34073 RepID=UPI00278E53B4|nr:autotransporter outer membrane beta-barrel domain-containing protein [Variovorax paradoxus]MDQ0571445.1 outer membrane autotransporter protein [Variovorax paradoxus]
MNKTFRSIWNEALGAWVAASEVSAARGKKSSGTVLAAGLLAAVAYGGASSAWAANECGAVAVGGTVICNGDGTPVGDANPNTTGIAYGTDGITVIVDGTAAPFTITPVTAPTTANGVYSGGGGTGNRRIEVNGPVTINVTTPAGNPVSGAAWAVLANSLASGAGGDASIVINGANITSKGENALGVATSVVGSGNATSILNSGSISTTGTQGSGVGLFAETHGIGTATVTVNGGSISTGTAAGGSHAAYALARGNGNAVATMTGGTATTQALNNSVVVAQTLGSGIASATISGGTATTNGASSTVIAVGSGSGDAIASQTGGTVIANGAGGVGLASLATGTGAATASMTGGSIATQGSNGYGIWAEVLNSASTAAATATMDAAASTITTTGTSGSGIYARNDGDGTATATLLNGRISTAGTYGYGLYAGTLGAGNAVASSSAGTSIQTSGTDGAKGILAHAMGTGNATAMNGGTVLTTGASGIDGNFGVYALATGGSANAGNTGTITTGGTFGYGVYAVTTGNGTATATSSGAITTNGPYSTGIGAHVDNFDSSKHGTAIATLQAAGTVATNGSPYGIGVFADVMGYGDAIATNQGAIATKGQFANGTAARVLYGAGDATAVNQGTISTTGIAAQGIQAAVDQGAVGNATALNTGTVTTVGQDSVGISANVGTVTSTSTATVIMNGGTVSTSGSSASGIVSSNAGLGLAAVQMNAGTVAATGLNADGLRAASAGGTYQVDVTGGSLTSGSGLAAAIHTTAAAGGTVNIGAAATVNGAASGIAIRDGDFAQTGTDTLGGNAVVTTAGTVTGDAILGLGNDSLALTGGRFSGNIYGDDRVASAADGNDSFTWTGGTLSGGFYGQNGSDTALVSAAGYNGSQVLDGGDDVSAADGWVDKLTLQGVTATAGGDTLRNWETITLDNTRLTLAGAPLVVGAGADAGGAPLGLFIQPTSSVFMGQPAFSVTGDVHNAGLIDLRNPAGTPGNLLSLYGNYAGANGIVRVNTALGSDASATDKLVVNGNTSGTSRVLVTNAGGAGAATINGIQVVQVTGTSSEGDFTLAAPVQAGAYEYGLHRGGRTDGDANSFYLSSVYNTPKPVPGVPSPAPVPVPAPEVLRPAVAGYVMGQVATQELGLGLLGSLHKRVGEQQTLKWDHCGCDDKAPADQLWMRLHAQRLDLDGKRQFGFEQEMQYVQLGKELAVRYSGDAADKSRSHTGLTAGYGRTSTHFSDRRRGDAGMGYDTGKMKGQMATLGAYHTRYADNGSYLDLVGQLHAVQNKYTDKYGGEGTQKGTGAGLSVEVGRPWQIGESQWLIEPQAQLSYQATRYRGFADNVSTVDGFTSQSLRGRVGARLAWNDKAERGDKLTRTNTFYVTADLLHEFKDPKAVTVGNTAVSEAWAKQTWAELGVGAQLPLSKAAYLYGGVQYQRSLSGTSREGVSGQLGVRVAW